MTTHATSTPFAVHIFQRVLTWLVFGGLVGLLPLILRALELGIRGGPFSWQAFLGDGELFVSSCAIAAGAMGDLLFAEPRSSTWGRFFRTIAGGMSVLMCVGNSAAYLLTKSAQGAQYAVGFSLVQFGGTIVIAGTCVAPAVER